MFEQVNKRRSGVHYGLYESRLTFQLATFWLYAQVFFEIVFIQLIDNKLYTYK